MSLPNIYQIYHLHKNDKMCKMMKMKMMKMQKRVKILRLTPPMSFSALKPGPVVPPGTQKVPNQAARISQSVNFGHLSDILGFLGGVPFFDIFWSFFTFHFSWFYHFCIFWFCHFSHFLDFVDFHCFLIFVNFSDFHVFFMFWFIFQFLKGYLKDKALFWPVFGPSVHSHGKHFGGVNSLCEKLPLFFPEFL